MRYKANIYVFLIYDFLTNLSPLAFIYTLYLTQQEITLTHAGTLLGVYQLSKLLFEIPSGFISDKLGRKKCGIFGQSVFILFLFITLFSRSFIVLFLGSVLRGIAYAFLSGTADCIFNESILKSSPNKMDFWLSIDKCLFYTSIGLSGIIGGFLATFRYDIVFYFDILMQFLSLLCIFQFRETSLTKMSRKQNDIKVSLKKAIKNRKIVYLLLLPSIIAIIFLPYEDYYSVILRSQSIPEFEMGILTGMPLLISAVAGMFTQKLNQKFGYGFTVKGLPILSAIIFSIMIVFLDHVFAAWGLYVLCEALSNINNTSYNSCFQKEIESTSRATLMSLRSFGIALTAIVISPIVGWSCDHFGFKLTFLTSAFICLFILFFINLVYLNEGSFELQ
ncbi:MFS transporter [Faecalicoccus pleomorphus]|uniref:MFS transporter n=1 Tax=Faecalicoccus pleomorphus TaxID=1323 RepID=UPI00189C372A|nr:MFS transporter [Faecalicoccus pleomorphus]